MKRLPSLTIRAYQLVFSPYMPSICRFTPSCSEYAEQAILRHGPTKGIFLGLKRLARCRPFGAMGYDPVP